MRLGLAYANKQWDDGMDTWIHYRANHGFTDNIIMTSKLKLNEQFFFTFVLCANKGETEKGCV